MVSPTCEFCQMQSDLDASGVIYQDVLVFALPDFRPQANHHYLILPRAHIESVDSLTEADAPIWIHLLLTAQKLARVLKFDIDAHGYRIQANSGRHSTRKWPHLHLHLLSDNDTESPRFLHRDDD